ncbi:MAG: hypothetical protein LBH81_03370 [Rickettsiales bacterium]|jgi:hypothetical protein|nr:hypothetical protein [Rickettsiales bacterium]
MNIDIAYIFYQSAAIFALIAVSFFPIWLGKHNEIGGYDMARVMFGALVLGWTVFGWLYALYLSGHVKKSEK